MTLVESQHQRDSPGIAAASTGAKVQMALDSARGFGDCHATHCYGKKRLTDAVKQLSSAFALAVPHPEAIRVRDDVGFFQAVRSVLNKVAPHQERAEAGLDHAIRQIVSQAVASTEVLDIFETAGLKKPDISILSDQFLAEVHELPQKNLAVELLKKLLLGEIKTRSRRNVVQSRLFSDLLEKAIRKYQNRAVETAQVIEELIGLAKEMREAQHRGKELGLSFTSSAS